MKDISLDANAKALKHARDLWNKLVKKRVIDNYQFTQKMSLVSTTVDFSGFKNIDVTIEAIVEDMAIKKKVTGISSKDKVKDNNAAPISAVLILGKMTLKKA